MMDYHWPGNIRELRNNIEYAFAMGTGSRLEFEDLTPELRGIKPPENTDMETWERDKLLQALKDADGNKGRAAELAGMSRPTFWRKCKLHQIY